MAKYLLFTEYMDIDGVLVLESQRLEKTGTIEEIIQYFSAKYELLKN